MNTLTPKAFLAALVDPHVAFVVGEPELGHPVFWGWMSKGQLLAIPMIFLGIIWLIACTMARYPRGKERVPTP